MQEQIIRFNRIFKQLDDVYRQAAKACGISESTLWILYMLRESDEMLTQRMLCQRMMQPKQSINSALKKMEADGWIILLPDERDRRSRIVSLTPSGIAVAHQTADRILEAERRAFGSFSAAELEAYFRLLKRHAQQFTHFMSLEGEDL